MPFASRPPGERRSPAPQLDKLYASSGRLIGYARAGRGASLDDQFEALNAAGCARIFSGQDLTRGESMDSGLQDCLDFVRGGDTLVTVDLSCLGLTTRHLADIAEYLRHKRAKLWVLDLGLDRSASTNDLVLTVLAAAGSMERELLVERARRGAAWARTQGRRPGRKPVLDTDQVHAVGAMHSDGATQVAIAAAFGTSTRTIRRALERLAAEAIS